MAGSSGCLPRAMPGYNAPQPSLFCLNRLGGGRSDGKNQLSSTSGEPCLHGKGGSATRAMLPLVDHFPVPAFHYSTANQVIERNERCGATKTSGDKREKRSTLGVCLSVRVFVSACVRVCVCGLVEGKMDVGCQSSETMRRDSKSSHQTRSQKLCIALSDHVSSFSPSNTPPPRALLFLLMQAEGKMLKLGRLTVPSCGENLLRSAGHLFSCAMALRKGGKMNQACITCKQKAKSQQTKSTHTHVAVGFLFVVGGFLLVN